MTPAIYLDHNATTQPAPQVVAEMLDALQLAWANPSSTHAPGQAARRLLADARARVAAFLGCQGAELVFTSGATEANHMAVLGALAAARAGGAQGRRRWVLSAVEHPGLLALAQRLTDEGVPVDRIGVDAQGRLDLAQARALIGGDVALVSLMGANNETGVLMPLGEIAALAQARGALLHVDATQLAGKTPLCFATSGADLMSVSAHKLAGPKGTGALLVRKGLALPPLLSGRQERHRRGGTENLPGIAGFGAACDLAAATLGDDLSRVQALHERLEDGLTAIDGVHLYGRHAARLPNTSCLRFGELDAEQVLSRLERAGIVASSGAACSAGGTQPSHVLLAMGASAAQAKAGVRFSLGRSTTAADIDAALATVQRVIVPLLEPQPLAA
ncbi:cysteine desulfurase family protein [uncultured Piscinibacter sp.]|uniref:cysteine desulfurase family protein n=1 Tax=uncultured Piscinibacter sp. TaxID=1131835 RepID=UPI00261F35FA|nr:cysteine desulfurase family protein [uncultured Piscinibacter sp.]